MFTQNNQFKSNFQFGQTTNKFGQQSSFGQFGQPTQSNTNITQFGQPNTNITQFGQPNTIPFGQPTSTSTLSQNPFSQFGQPITTFSQQNNVNVTENEQNNSRNLYDKQSQTQTFEKFNSFDNPFIGKNEKVLSFNDVSIIPTLTNIKSQDEISLKTKITKNISLNIPIVSTSNNLDDIIKLNLSGGLGIFKCDDTNDLEKQLDFIKKIKKNITFIDESPVTVYLNTTFTQIQNIFNELNCDYISVLNESNQFLGFISKSYFKLISILDNNVVAHQIMISLEDIKFCNVSDYNWNNLLTENPNLTIINQLKNFPFIPILTETKHLAGIITLQNFIKYYTYKNYFVSDDKGRMYSAVYTIIYDNYLERLKKLVDAGLDFICIHIDNAYNSTLVNIIKEIKISFPSLKIIIGNVHSSSAFKHLSEAGADVIIVGNETEFAQFTLLKECFEYSKLYNVPIINNSGIPNQSKNIFLPFVAGSNCYFIQNYNNNDKNNYDIDDILKFIKNGLVSLNTIDINHLHSTNVEFITC